MNNLLSFISEHPQGSAFVLLIALYILYVIASRRLNPIWIAIGEDGKLSSSKLQFLIWTIVVLYSYIALAASRLGHAVPTNGDDSLPVNVLIAMGLSLTTASAAKGIAVAYNRNRQNVTPGINALAGRLDLQYLVTMDDGITPDLPKIQMLAWTVVAAVTYSIDLMRHFSAYSACTGAGPSSGSVACFPDIDTALMVLMGLGQGAYIGGKLVSTIPGGDADTSDSNANSVANNGGAMTPLHSGSTVLSSPTVGLAADVSTGFF
jgi:hypothetical protein